MIDWGSKNRPTVISSKFRMMSIAKCQKQKYPEIKIFNKTFKYVKNKCVQNSKYAKSKSKKYPNEKYRPNQKQPINEDIEYQSEQLGR